MTDNQEFVTFFFNKRLGIIKIYTTGTTDMSYYGEEQQDMELIYDFIVVPIDTDSREVMRTPKNFFVDIVAKEIRRREETVSKFQVQSITAMQEMIAAQPIAIDPIQLKEIL
ncbi:MAG TPA: hypothetical protein VIK34_05730 [Clostridiaceae bacterium]